MRGPWRIEWNAGRRWAPLKSTGTFGGLENALDVLRLLTDVNGGWAAFRVVDVFGERVVEIQPGARGDA